MTNKPVARNLTAVKTTGFPNIGTTEYRRSWLSGCGGLQELALIRGISACASVGHLLDQPVFLETGHCGDVRLLTVKPILLYNTIVACGSM